MTTIRSELGQTRKAALWDRVGPAAMVYGVLILGLLTVWPSLHSLALYWHDVPDYSHGMLVSVAVVVWLFLLRHEIAGSVRRGQPWALPVLCVALAFWLVAYRGNSELGHQLLVPPVLMLSVWAAFGSAAALRVLAPLAWFCFAIPVWEYLVPLLQHMTVVVTERLLHFFGIPVHVDGIYVTLPAGRFQVAEGCSGQRFLVVALAVASLGGVIAGLPRRRFVLLVVSAAAMALVANWIRVLIVILLGHFTQMQHYWVAKEHLSLGWIIFAVLLVCIALVARRLSRNVPALRAASAAAPSAPGGRVAVVTGAAVVLLLIATQFLRSIDAPESPNPRLGDWPVLAGEWQGPLPASSAWQPVFIGATQEARAAYRSDTATIEVYLNVYGRQTPGNELVFYQNTVAPPAGERWIVEHQYRIGGYATARAPIAQLLYGVISLTRAPPSGVLAFAARCDIGDCDAARDALADFKNQYDRALLALIPTH